MKIIAASDFHIGYLHDDPDGNLRTKYIKNSRKEKHYAKLNKFYDTVRAENPDQLILCGDIYDLWRFEWKGFIDDKELERLAGNKSDFKLLKGANDGLKKLVAEIPTIYIWGNHDYEVNKMIKMPVQYKKYIKIDNIYFCHGWRFDYTQKIASIIFRFAVKIFPSIYRWLNENSPGTKKLNAEKTKRKIARLKKDKKSPDREMQNRLKSEEEEYNAHRKLIHENARRYIENKKLDYLVMGHTHFPLAKDKLFDCGDMINSFTYILIENKVPMKIKMDDE